jgi:hypothetical protein
MVAVGNKNFLKSLGVRDTVDLKLVLERLELLQWDIRDLISFLVKEQSSFTPSDWNLLRTASFLPGVMFLRKSEAPSEGKEEGAAEKSETMEKSKGKEGQKQQWDTKPCGLRKASELFFPHDAVKDLGLPVLYWPDERTCHLYFVFLFCNRIQAPTNNKYKLNKLTNK